MPTKSETVPATASGGGDQQIAKSATPEQVEAANEEALKQQKANTKAGLETQLAALEAKGGDRQYVTDEDGIPRLAAAKGQPVPEWAEKMAEKTGGLSNTPKSEPEATA